MAETTIFIPLAQIEAEAEASADFTALLIGNPADLIAARRAIPANYLGGWRERPRTSLLSS